MSVKPVPAGYHTITAQLAIDGAEKAIEFYQKAFGAEVVDKALDPSGKKSGTRRSGSATGSSS